ncbi:hypothetical protein TMRO357_02063 [Alteriqipengyuania sp. 357]
MQPVYLAVLSALIFALAWQTLRDRRDYEVFKQLADTRKRRSFYARWTVFLWLAFGGGALAILGVMGRLDALTRFPAEFRADLPVTAPPEAETMSADTMIGFAVGAAIALTALFFLWRMRIRTLRQPVIGDIEPMLPREHGEYPYTAALSVAAGFTEELFFRLALPLLAFYATGSAIAAFAIATVLFGAMHWYQGGKRRAGDDAGRGILRLSLCRQRIAGEAHRAACADRPDGARRAPRPIIPAGCSDRNRR